MTDYLDNLHDALLRDRAADRIGLLERIRASLRFRRRYTLTSRGAKAIGSSHVYRPVQFDQEGR